MAVWLLFQCAPPTHAAGLEDLIFTTNIGQVLTLGVEIGWGFDDHWLLRVGVPVRLESEVHNLFEVWGRGVFLYRVQPFSWLTAYGGLGMTTGISFDDNLKLRPFFEVPLGVQVPLFGDFDAIGEIRIGLNNLIIEPLESLRFITLTVGIAFAMH